MLPEDEWLLVGLLNNTTQSFSCSSTTRIRELNHLWEFFLTEKAELNILMLTIITIAL